MPKDNKIYSISELNQLVRGMLETRFSTVWLEGEISNFSRPASGHMYFTLKDSNAQIRCAMFRGKNIRLNFKPESGIAIRAKGNVSLYEARGDYQFIVDTMQPAGEGALQQAFEALKQKLKKEGLFDSSRKKPLPDYPTKLGLITSPTGAAIRDVLTVLKRRYPLLDVTVFSTAVQGDEAAGKIVIAIEKADKSNCDVILLTRGGGSIEDLWSFNEEVVARAVAACSTPLICGVGHETDFSIAEFVADVRAATPSAAAELISPDCEKLKTLLTKYSASFTDSMTRTINQLQQTIGWLDKRLNQQHPEHQMDLQCQRLTQLRKQLSGNIQASLHQFEDKLNTLRSRLQQLNPQERLTLQKSRFNEIRLRLQQAQIQQIQATRARLDVLTRGLDTVSPLATLNRGYSIITDASGALIDDASKVKPGDSIAAQLAKGELMATVDEH